MGIHPANLINTEGWFVANEATSNNLVNSVFKTVYLLALWSVEPTHDLIWEHHWLLKALSGLFLTNGFGAHRSGLELHHAQDQKRTLNIVLAKPNPKTVDAGSSVTGEKPIFSLSIGSTGTLFEPSSYFSQISAPAGFSGQDDSQPRVGLMLCGFRPCLPTQTFQRLLKLQQQQSYAFALR